MTNSEEYFRWNAVKKSRDESRLGRPDGLRHGEGLSVFQVSELVVLWEFCGIVRGGMFGAAAHKERRPEDCSYRRR